MSCQERVVSHLLYGSGWEGDIAVKVAVIGRESTPEESGFGKFHPRKRLSVPNHQHAYRLHLAFSLLEHTASRLTATLG